MIQKHVGEKNNRVSGGVVKEGEVLYISTSIIKTAVMLAETGLWVKEPSKFSISKSKMYTLKSYR